MRISPERYGFTRRANGEAKRTQGRQVSYSVFIRAPTGEGRERAKARGVKMGRPHKLTPHQQKEAIKRRDRGDESLTEIGRSYNVSAATISRLAP